MMADKIWVKESKLLILCQTLSNKKRAFDKDLTMFLLCGFLIGKAGFFLINFGKTISKICCIFIYNMIT